MLPEVDIGKPSVPEALHKVVIPKLLSYIYIAVHISSSCKHPEQKCFSRDIQNISAKRSEQMTENPPQAAGLLAPAVRRVSRLALALALSFLFKLACREMDGIDNRLIITSDAR